jgi:hypothetical protein
VAALPHDLWLIVCLHLHHSPHAVFRFMMTNKSLRGAFISMEAVVTTLWWKTFFDRVCAYQASLKHSNFRKRLLEYEAGRHMPHATILRAVFSPRCEGCGARFGHRLLRPFSVRVCAACLPLLVISNHALEQHYGVALFDFLETYAATTTTTAAARVGCGGGGGGGSTPLILPLDAFQDRRLALERLSNNNTNTKDNNSSEFAFFSYEWRSASHIRAHTLVYLWRADVERAIGCSLHALAGPHTARRSAAARLSACVRRLGEHRLLLRDLHHLLLLGCGGVVDQQAVGLIIVGVSSSGAAVVPLIARALRAQSHASARRHARMLAPVPQWMPGGHLNSASGLPRAHWLSDDGERVRRLQAILADALRTSAPRSISRSSDWFPQKLPTVVYTQRI